MLCTDVSVIICAYTLDRWSDLVAAIDSVRHQTCPPSQLVVVVDHNDELLTRLLELAPELATDSIAELMIVPNVEHKGLSGARNTGLAIATRKIVAFLDDDAVASPTWLDELVNGYSSDNVLGVGGFIAPLWETKRPGWFPEEFDWVLGCTYRGMLEGAEVRNLIGANMSFRRDVLVDVGGFSHALGRTSTKALGDEETDACIRASQLHPDGVFIYTARAHVDHRVPAWRTTWRYFRQRCYAEGISKAGLTSAVGSKDALSSERRHALVTLPAGVGRALKSFVRGDGAGLGRAIALVAGLAFTAAGYLVGRLFSRVRAHTPHAPAHTPRDAATSRPHEEHAEAPLRPRILMITPRYFPLVGGVEHHVSQVARLMTDDAEVTLLTTDTTGELPEAETIDGVNVMRVRAWPRRADYYFAPALSRVVREGDWDLVHVQSAHTAVAPLAMIAALRARIPYVVTFHGGGHSSRLRGALRGLQWAVLRPLLARADKLIAVATFEAERFSRILRLPIERFAVIPNGSDLPSIPPKEAKRLRAQGGTVIVSVGRLERYKGHHRVIEAMPAVLAALPKCKLRILGSGPYEPELRQLVERLDLADKVTIESIPPAERLEMTRALAGSSLFVLMSEFETHPLAVIEALALGRPALVADTSGLSELATSGLARAIPLGSTTGELAETIVSEIRNPRTVPCLSPPTWHECANKLIALYRDVLSSPPNAKSPPVEASPPPEAKSTWFADDAEIDFVAEANAGITWMSGVLRWQTALAPALVALFGVACVASADAMARQGISGAVPLWWVGMLSIFVPAAATLLFTRVSRTEAVFLLLYVGFAVYVAKLVYAPGMLWGFDELLHYRTADNLLQTGHLFSRNSLLEVSPYYPGMETVTATIVQITGLDITRAGMILIGMARLLMVASVFLLFERVAMPSRFAALATLLYMACPAYLYFDSMYGYESLALALAMACVFTLRAAQLEEAPRRAPLNVVAAILLLAVVVTHHVTSFILAATLAIWTIFEFVTTIRARGRSGGPATGDWRASKRQVYLSDLPGSGWVPAMGVIAVAVWLLNVAEVTISYLTPQLMAGLTEMLKMIRFEGAGRKLFESSAGHSAPLLERAVGIGSVLIILALIPLAMKYLWEKRHSNALSHSLAIGSLAYPAILALRFTKSGWDAGSRATAFVYVPLAFALAAGFEFLIARRLRNSNLNRLGAAAILVASSVVFAGGIVAGTSPVTRLPSPYDPGVSEVPCDPESRAAASWAATTLGPGHRFAADSAGGTLLGSVGRQEIVTSLDGVSISQLFLSPGFDAAERSVVKNGRIDYVMVDRRIANTEPFKGFIYEKWEREVLDYGSTVSSATVNKFDVIRDASKEFDSGNIEFFSLDRLVR
jgi:glycogen synthase